jgi:hypothetical protein
MTAGAARVAAAALGLAVLHGVWTLGFFLFGLFHIERAWLGGASRDTWANTVIVNNPQAAYLAAGTIRDPGARILIVGEGRPFSCPRPHHASSPYDTQLIQAIVERSKTADDVRRAVKDAGFSHLLINWAELNRLGGDGFEVLRWRSPDDEKRFREFGTQLTERLWADGALEIRLIR